MEFDLRQYFKLALKWWWLLAIGVIIPMIVSYYLAAQQDPLYQARVVLMVGRTLASADPNARDIGIAEHRVLGQGLQCMAQIRATDVIEIDLTYADLRGMVGDDDALAGAVVCRVTTAHLDA